MCVLFLHVSLCRFASVVSYLQLTTKFIQAMYCVDYTTEGTTRSVLAVEPTTECYTKAHFASAFFFWPAFFFYTIGFPLAGLYLVLRTRSQNLWSSSASRLIYLYYGLKIRYLYFKTASFITSFALALQISLSSHSSSTAARMFTAIAFFGLETMAVGVLWPFMSKRPNLLHMAAGLANAVSGLALLTVMSEQVGGESSQLGSLKGGPLFALGFGMLIFFMLMIYPARLLHARFGLHKGVDPKLDQIEAEEDLLLQRQEYDKLTRSRVLRGAGLFRRKGQLYKASENSVAGGEVEMQLHVPESKFGRFHKRVSTMVSGLGAGSLAAVSAAGISLAAPGSRNDGEEDDGGLEAAMKAMVSPDDAHIQMQPSPLFVDAEGKQLQQQPAPHHSPQPSLDSPSSMPQPPHRSQRLKRLSLLMDPDDAPPMSVSSYEMTTLASPSMATSPPSLIASPSNVSAAAAKSSSNSKPNSKPRSDSPLLTPTHATHDQCSPLPVPHMNNVDHHAPPPPAAAAAAADGPPPLSAAAAGDSMQLAQPQPQSHSPSEPMDMLQRGAGAADVQQELQEQEAPARSPPTTRLQL